MTNKNTPNIHSDAFREGFRNALEGYTYNIYSANTNYSGYIDFRAGLEQGKREIKMYGLDYVKEYFRFRICSSAIGKSVDEVKKIIRLADGSIPRYEFDAILLYLDSTLESFNIGVRDFLRGIPRPLCENKIKIAEYEDWNVGYRAAELAVKLHNKETVMQQLLQGM